jgi:hypothetical protein
MSTDVFHNPTKTVPKSDSRIVSQDFEKQDIGARKSHMPSVSKNDLTIRHVGGSKGA